MLRYRANPPLAPEPAPEVPKAAPMVTVVTATAVVSQPTINTAPDSDSARSKRKRARSKAGDQHQRSDISLRVQQYLIERTGQCVPDHLPVHKQWKLWGDLNRAVLERDAADWFKCRK
jgi:hypothetical protein